MVFIGTWEKQKLAIRLRSNGITVSIGESSQASVISYDSTGRLWSFFLNGISYRRGLNGNFLVKQSRPGNSRKRWWITDEKALEIEQHAYEIMQALYTALQRHEIDFKNPLPSQGYIQIQRAASFDQTRSKSDTETFHRIYKPVGILPPDQYMAVVLQATEGCSFNTCTFCSFYKNQPFHIKRPDEFEKHAAEVHTFLGEGLSIRRGIFLADANALVVPMPKLVPLFEKARHIFKEHVEQGVFSFLDGFSGEKKSADDYHTLHKLGLRRVYIGLESGHDPLLQFLRKPGTAQDAIHAVNTLKAANVNVGVIILLGAGGHQFAEEHIEDTVKTLNTMNLDKGDIVYFSELIENDELLYAQEANRVGINRLTHQQRLEQQEKIQAGLQFTGGRSGPILSRYDIREFIY